MKKNSKAKKNLVIGLIIVGFLALVFVVMGLSQTALPEGEIAPSGIYVDVPTIKYYECAPASEAVSSNWLSVPSVGTGFITCPEDKTDQCDIEIRAPAPEGFSSFFTNYRILYQVCDIGGDCQAQVEMPSSRYAVDGIYATAKYNNLLKSQQIWIDYQKKSLFTWKGTTGAQYRMLYKPFIIWKDSVFEGRIPFTSPDQGCVYDSSIEGTIVVSATFPLPSDTNTRTGELPPYKTDNFVDRFIPIQKSNYQFVEYQGKEGYCMNGNIYGIDSITLNGGTYKVVDVGTNPLVSNKDCCPGDATPNAICVDFEWETIVVDEDTGETNVECSAFNPCPQASWNPVRDGTSRLASQQCIDGTCVYQYKDVECVNNEDCGIGETCDTSTYTCVDVSITEPVYEEIGELPTCESCEEFALSTLIGKVYEPAQCENTLFQTNTTCASSYLKLFLLPLIFILGLAILPGTITRLQGKKKPTKAQKNVNRIIAFIVSSILTVLIYFIFVWGLIIAFIAFTLKPLLIAFVGGKK